MEEFTKSKVELSLAIEEQKHQIKLRKIEFKETYGLTAKESIDNRFITSFVCFMLILAIVGVFKLFIT